MRVYDRALTNSEVADLVAFGLVGHWRFDETSGSTAADSAGGDNPGTVVGATFVNDADRGRVLSLAGSGDHVEVSPVVDLGPVWTISSWFKGLVSAGTWRTLTRGQGVDHQIIVSSSGELGSYETGGTGFNGSGFDMNVLSSGWHHLAAVGSGGSTVFYVDGVAVGSVGFQSTSDVFSLGNYQGGGQRFSDYLDDMRVYDRALSSGEVAAAANPTLLALGSFIPDLNSTSELVAAGSQETPKNQDYAVSEANAENQVPVFTSTAITSTIAGETYTHPITTSDSESTIEAAPAWLGLEDHADGTAPLTEVGDHLVSLTVTDDQDTDTQSFAIEVSLRTVQLDAKGKAQFTDASGDLVTVMLKGGGTGTLYFAQSGNCDLERIELTGTTAKSSLVITVKRSETTVKEIIVHGSLKSLIAKTTDLLGRITIDGSIKTLVMDDVADDHVLTIGASSNAKATATLSFDRVVDLSVNSLTPIKSFKASEWLGGSLTTSWISSLCITGKSRDAGVLGNLSADVTLTGANAKGKALNKLSVSGRFINSSLLAPNGSIGTVRFGAMENSSCLVGAATGSDVDGDGVLDLPDPADIAPGTNQAIIKKLTIKGIKGDTSASFVNSNIAAAYIGTVALTRPQYSNGGVAFGLAAEHIKKLMIADLKRKASFKKLDTSEDSRLPDEDDFEIRLV